MSPISVTNVAAITKPTPCNACNAFTSGANDQLPIGS